MDDIQKKCIELKGAYTNGLLGDQTMPEDTHPVFETIEQKLSYFTLPMSLNYQRNSYTLWESAKKTCSDHETGSVFDVVGVAQMDTDELRAKLMKYKVALQPNKHVQTWQKISQTIATEWGSISNLLKASEHDFLKLQSLVQGDFKKGFPYLSGPKIFHYWCYILGEYCDISLANREFIQIAPDTHVIQCSVKLGVLSSDEAVGMNRDEISERWRKVLAGTGLSPIDMHSPLWFWSKNNFKYELSDDVK
jgi:hypothetical protein